MNRRHFLGLVGATPALSYAGLPSKEKPLGFDLPKVSNIEELEVAINEVVAHFNRRFRGKMGPRQAITHKGNPYITFVNGFPKRVGDPSWGLMLSKDPQEALRNFYWGIEEYCSADPNKQLVWRILPEVTIDPDYPNNYKIRTRLVFE